MSDSSRDAGSSSSAAVSSEAGVSEVVSGRSVAHETKSNGVVADADERVSDEQRRDARSVQQRLERFYSLEPGPDVSDFLRRGNHDSREALFVRHGEDGVEVGLMLPGGGRDPRSSDDERLQLLEGVSHFVYLAERARVDLPMTELELELQAEVDKFVLLAFDGKRLAAKRARSVRASLYESVRYLHDAASEKGARYRLANDLAARVSHRLVERLRDGEAHHFLRRFYRAGQAEKIRLASAA
ncbi:MAG TPA: hypothetical protein VH142_26260 [Polyangiaceae bacterium]|nr:hypothetical protein [Polyangiaceae bacterium]